MMVMVAKKQCDLSGSDKGRQLDFLRPESSGEGGGKEDARLSVVSRGKAVQKKHPWCGENAEVPCRTE